MWDWVLAFSVALLCVVSAQYAELPPRPPPPTEELPTEVGWFEASHGFPNAQQAPEVGPTVAIPLATPSVSVKDEIQLTALLQGRSITELVRISLTMYARCTECFLGYVHIQGEPGKLYLLDVEETLSALEESVLISVVARLGVLCQACFDEVLANPSTLLPLPSSNASTATATAATTSSSSAKSEPRTTTSTTDAASSSSKPQSTTTTRTQTSSVAESGVVANKAKAAVQQQTQAKATNTPKPAIIPIPFMEAIPKIPIFNAPPPTLKLISRAQHSTTNGNSHNENHVSSSNVNTKRDNDNNNKNTNNKDNNNNSDDTINTWKSETIVWNALPASWAPLPLPEINPRILPRPSGEYLASPIRLREFDRLGYIRFRKAASTSLQNHFLMRGVVDLCTQKCDFQSCLYASTCNVTLHCEQEDMQLSGYPCSHMGLDMITNSFKVEKARWAQFYQDDPVKLKEVQEGLMYFVTILRDPVKRVISEFFYAKHANVTQDWKGMYPEKIRPSIIEGNLTKFAEFGDMNVAMNRMSLQIIKRDYPEPLFFKPPPAYATEEQVMEVREAHMQARRHLISAALHYLRQCRIVLIAEYLSQSLMLLRHVLGRDATTYVRPLIIRKSPKDQARVATEQDPAVLAAVAKASWADQMLYEEAKQMFFSAFQAMLESRGEVVTDIHASLAKYHVPGFGVKATRSSEFPGLKSEEPDEDSFQADGNYYILVPHPM